MQALRRKQGKHVAIPFGKCQLAKLRGANPAKWFLGSTIGLAESAAKEVQPHAAMRVLLQMHGQRLQDVHAQTRLLLAFAPGSLRRRLAPLHLAAGEFPQTLQRRAAGPGDPRERRLVLHHGHGNGRCVRRRIHPRVHSCWRSFSTRRPGEPMAL